MMSSTPESLAALDAVLGQYRGARDGGERLDQAPPETPVAQQQASPENGDGDGPVEAVLRQTRGAREANDGCFGCADCHGDFAEK